MKKTGLADMAISGRNGRGRRWGAGVALAAFMPMLALAAVTYDGVTYPATKSEAASMGYVTLSNEGNYYLDSPFGTSATSHNNLIYWSDEGVPDPAKNYFATGCRSVTGSGTAYTCSFGGNRLVLSGWYQWKTQDPYYMDFPHEGVFILPDVTFVNGQIQNRAVEQKITGTMTVLATSSKPFILMPTYGPPTAGSINTAGFDLACTLKGPSTAVISCRRRQVGAARGWLRVTGDTSAYYGKLSVNSNDLYVGACGLANAEAVAISETATLRPYAADGAAVTLSGLSVDARSAVVLNPTNRLVISGTLALADGAKIKVETESFTDSVERVAIMSAPAGSGIEKHLETGSFCPGFVGSRFGSVSVDVADGRETVYLTLDNSVVRLMSSDGDPSTINTQSAFTNATKWSDGKVVHGGSDYYVSDGMTLRTLEEGRGKPLDFAMTYPSFPGASLTLGVGSTFALRQTSMRVDKLLLSPKSTIHIGNTHVKFLTGDIVLLGEESDSPATIWTYYVSANGTNQVNSDIYGVAPLNVSGNAGSGEPRGHVMLGGVNTNWTGRLAVTIGNCTTAGREAPTWQNTAFLHVTNALALGGARAAFTRNALTLEQCGALCVENGNEVVFDTANRGVFVKDRGQVIVGPGSALAFANDVTYCGELRKTGAGLFALGGTARFGADGASAPTAGSNVLNCVSGSFKPLSARCLDGVSATFGAGVSLVYDLAPSDASFGSTGVVLENPASSLAFADADVPVTFACGAAQFGGATHTVGLLTASEETARAFAGRLSIAKPAAARDYTVEKVVTPAGGGLWTVFAVVRPSGLTLIFR